MRIFKFFTFIFSIIITFFIILFLNNIFFSENDRNNKEIEQSAIYYEDEVDDTEYEISKSNGGVVDKINTFIKKEVENKTEEIIDGVKTNAESTFENIVSEYFTLDGISKQISKLKDTITNVYDLLNRPNNMKDGNYLVVKVSDGDTITVNKIIDGKVDNENIRVRLLHIDAPEVSQTYGDKSAEFLKKLVYNKEVSIEYENTDRYGRILGIIYVDGMNVNEEMVRTGNAWWFRRYSPNAKTYEKLEKEAKKSKLGLFATKNPTEPWKYREQMRGKRNK